MASKMPGIYFLSKGYIVKEFLKKVLKQEVGEKQKLSGIQQSGTILNTTLLNKRKQYVECKNYVKTHTHVITNSKL